VHTIDLNADLGEGFGHWPAAADDAILPLVSSASIACGFHAGDPVTMRRTVAAARRLGVTVGAHPGYPDLLGFGRRDLDATPTEITAYVLYQLGALAAVCRAEEVELRYVKPHGALYNRAAIHAPTAAAIADAVRRFDASLTLLGLADSHLLKEAEAAGLRTAPEAFADRRYEPDGTLVRRTDTDAVLTDASAVADQALGLARDGTVTARDGTLLTLHPHSLCLHGDTPNAPALLGAIRARFAADGIGVAPFAR
jgi:UPF0271 protein